MKPAAGKLPLVTIVLLMLLAPALALAPMTHAAPAPSPAPQTPGRGAYDLLAHGNEKALWVAEVVPNNDPLTPGTRTQFRYRTPGDGANWRPLGQVAARAVALSDRGSELLVLLESGDWLMVSDTGSRSGPSLPGQGNVVAIAGDADNVWAVGEGARAASTQPTTAPSTQTGGDLSSITTATTGPAPRATTTTAPVETGLFRLQRGGWIFQAALPENVRANDVAAMTLIDQRPLIAVINPRDQQLRVCAYTNDGWSQPSPITTLPPEPRVALLNRAGLPIIAITDRASATTTIHVGGQKWSDPVKLDVSPEAADMRYRAAAAGLGQLRVLSSSGSGTMIEQPYELTGRLAGKSTESTQQPTFPMGQFWFVLEVLAMVVLMAVMLGTLRRRGAIQLAARHLDQLHIAPLGHRFGAGLIDAVPLLLSAVIASPDTSAPFSAWNPTPAQLAWMSGGMALYLLHTTATEMFAGRTIGKIMFGLRVVALDGSRPSALAVLLRNLLRIIDVNLIFPLILMMFLPLRQRLGDLAAGTLVVSDQAPEPEEDEDTDQ